MRGVRTRTKKILTGGRARAHTPDMTPGKKLRAWREARDLTQAQLAPQLDIDRSTLSRLEQDDATPELATAVRIASLTSEAGVELIPVKAWVPGEPKSTVRKPARRPAA